VVVCQKFLNSIYGTHSPLGVNRFLELMKEGATTKMTSSQMKVIVKVRLEVRWLR
jgi:hypothetical protein